MQFAGRNLLCDGRIDGKYGGHMIAEERSDGRRIARIGYKDHVDLGYTLEHFERDPERVDARQR